MAENNGTKLHIPIAIAVAIMMIVMSVFLYLVQSIRAADLEALKGRDDTTIQQVNKLEAKIDKVQESIVDLAKGQGIVLKNK